jgi:hypothetical protein
MFPEIRPSRLVPLLGVLVLVSFVAPRLLSAQGVTTGAMNGIVRNTEGEDLVGATVTAVHEPTGNQYGTVVREGGAYDIRGMRVGGPYTISAQILGYETQSEDDVFVSLNQTVRTDFALRPEAIEVAGIDVRTEEDPVLNANRTGAATYVSQAQVEQLPSIKRSTRDLTRLDPRSDGNFSFGGKNWLYNSISLDGSYFGNPFGLDDPAPGGQTNAEPVPYDAIEQVQVSIAPFDVRQSGFTGASINSVTKSGTNDFTGTAYTFYRNESFIGSKVSGNEVLNPDLKFNQSGISVGGPIIRDKLFFFINGEIERRDDPGVNFLAARPGVPSGPSVSRVQASDLEAIRQRLIDAYDYDPGAFEGYIHQTDNDKLIAKIDWDVNTENKFTFRYNLLDAVRDLPPHPFAISLNNTGRGPNENSLPFENTGYAINNELNSFAGEVNSQYSTWANRLFVSYNRFRDFREPKSGPFPTLEIAEDGITYTTVGHEPFSIHNLLDQDVWQLTNDFSLFRGSHVYTIGTNFESFEFGNSFNLFYHGLFFLPVEFGGTAFDSVEEFLEFTDPNSPNFRDFNAEVQEQLENPFKDDPSHFGQWALYVQDEWLYRDNVKLTYGLRIDVPLYFTDLPPAPFADNLQLQDENGNPEQITFSEFPDMQILWSPRFGFNWDVRGDRSMQVRGGTGIFTGRLPFVWLGNQVANQGPDANEFDINATVSDFKWPQVWRTDLALDQELPGDALVTFEFLYGKDVNGIFVRNPNLADPVGTIPGPDGRLRWNPAANRLNAIPTGGDTYVVDNTDEGYDVSFTTQLRKTFGRGLNGSIAYNFNEATNKLSSTEIAFALWQFNAIEGHPNNFDDSFSEFGHRHRIVGTANYRHVWSEALATSFGLFFEAAKGGFFTAGRRSRFSFTYAGDVNGDGIPGNDLIYIPRSQDEILFDPVLDTQGNVVRSADQQWQLFNALIEQDDYLSEHRGQIAERNGGIVPWYSEIDLRVLQDFSFRDHTFQVILDLLNLGNMINSDWGVRELPNVAATTPLVLSRFDASGRPVFRFPGTASETFINDVSELSRWRAQLGFRYIFD